MSMPDIPEQDVPTQQLPDDELPRQELPQREPVKRSLAKPHPVALIIGAGDATGGAIARRFAKGGYTACVTRRNFDKLRPLLEQIEADGGKAHGFASDARKEEEVAALVEQIETTIGPIEVLVFNIGANVSSSVLDETPRKYFKIWEMACFGGFLNAKEVARRMVTRPADGHRQTIIFTGATASLRGAANYAAFAGAKHALRALAQSMARELGPRGIHVCHVVVDGAIDTEFIRERFPERYALKDQDGILNPDHIADSYWMLHQQQRDAWTHELDLRPWMEKF
jgi:NAD(P)-dependent dehydrogenase (short-subunit alcohol dehydrogenase family)